MEGENRSGSGGLGKALVIAGVIGGAIFLYHDHKNSGNAQAAKDTGTQSPIAQVDSQYDNSRFVGSYELPSQMPKIKGRKVNVREGILGKIFPKKVNVEFIPGPTEEDRRQEYLHRANLTGPYANCRVVKGVPEPYTPKTQEEAWVNSILYAPRGYLAYNGMNKDNTDGEERRMRAAVWQCVKLGIKAASIYNAAKMGVQGIEALAEAFD